MNVFNIKPIKKLNPFSIQKRLLWKGNFSFMNSFLNVSSFTRRYLKSNFWNSFKNTSFIVASGNVVSVNGEILLNGKPLRKKSNGNFSKFKITLDDEEQTCELSQIVIEIKNCSVSNITASNGSIEVHGNVDGDVETSNATITIDGNVTKNATTSNGNIKIGGSLGGKAKTSNGNVYHK